MASTSSSHRQNAFSGIEPPNKRRKIEESSRVYDVFINHRGPDVKKTLATQLYNSLKALRISAFLDSEEKELGNSFTSIIETAIRSSSVHIAIFSKGYAQSAWCLAELVLMLQTNAKIIPVFYQVKPSELRYIEKGKGVYAEAFHQYENKGRYLDKLKEWKEALEKVSYTAGVELNPDTSDINDIVSAVEKEVQRTRRLHVARYPVGLDKLVNNFERRCLDKLVQDYESLYGMKKAAKERANVVGIFGMGGVGKTTLSLELFNQKRSNYTKVSFLRDVREAYARGNLPLLQSKLLEDIFCKGIPSNQEGTSCLRHCFERSSTLSFLIVLDDIDHAEQLDALLPMDVLNTHGNANHLVIITTRDVGVLVGAEIDIAYHLRGLDRKDGRELFCWHAFKQSLPVCGYEDLVEAFVNVCGCLPLSLIVLGRHVFRREREYWQDELEKVKETLPTDIKHRLKISIDRLDDVEKQIFMDIACFFIGKSVSKAMLIWKGSGWRARRALETLKERCLIEEVKEEHLNRLEYKWESTLVGYAFRMHDHLRDLGREMADELSNPHRVWRAQDLKSLESNGFQNILTQTKSRTFHSTVDKSIGCEITYFLGKPKDGSDASLLWLQLEYLSCFPLDLNLDINSSIPSWVPLQNLQCLRISNGCFQKLWQSDVEAPSHLEEFQIRETFVEEFPDLLGRLNNMKILVLDNKYIQTDVWSLLEYLKMNLRSFRMVGYNLEGHLAYNDAAEETALKSVVIYDSKRLWEGRVALSDEGWCRTVMSGLENLEIHEYLELEELRLAHLSCLKNISIENCEKIQHIILPTSLIKLDVQCCRVLQRVAVAGDHPKLTQLIVTQCPALEELPSFAGVSDLVIIEFDLIELQKITLPTGCVSPCITGFDITGCRDLLRIQAILNCRGHIELYIAVCPKLDLRHLCSLKNLEKIQIKSCEKLQNITLPTTLSKMDVRICSDFQRIEGTSDVKRLVIEQCPALEELPSPSELNCLEDIEIRSCEKLQNIRLPTTLSKLDVYRCTVLHEIEGTSDVKRLVIEQCPALEELPSPSELNCLEEIKIRSCEKLQNIRLPTTLSKLDVYGCTVLQGIEGTSDLKKLVIRDCPALEELPSPSELNCLEEMEIRSCEKLQNIRLPTTLSKLDLYGCTVLQGIEGTSDLKRLVIRECPALEELPSPSELNCLEEIEIRSCEKLQNITLPTTLSKLDVYGCTVLQGIAGIAALIKLTRLCIAECPALELPCLGRLICIEKIEIDSCKNLQNIISAAEELHVPEYTRLSNCGYAVTRYFIDRWKSLPRRTCLIVKAVDGAESSLNLSLFSEANIAVDGVTEITDADSEVIYSDDSCPDWSGMSVVIVCLAVDSWTLAEDINRTISRYDPKKMRQGESRVTVVVYTEDKEHEIPSIVKGFRVHLEESEKWKSMRLLRTIVDRLYKE